MNSIKTLWQPVLDKIWIIETMTWLECLAKIVVLFDSDKLITSENERHYTLNRLCINDKGNKEINAIDDEYIRIGDDLIRWAPIFPIVTEVLGDLEEPTFKVWDIVRLIDKKTIRELGRQYWFDFTHLLPFVGERFTVDNPNYSRKKFWVEVIVSWWNDSNVMFPQKLIVLARSKNILLHHYKRIKMGIRSEILRNKDQNINIAAERYQIALRSFMDAKSKLHDTMVWDVTKEVEEVFRMRLCAREEIMKLEPVVDCNINDDFLDFTTKCLTLTHEEHEYPMWAYKVTFNKKYKDIRVENITINTNQTAQHVHVWSDGRCCLWEFASLFWKCFASRDNYWLVITALEFLQSYNPGSPVKSLEPFMDLYESKFEEAAKLEKKIWVDKIVDTNPLDDKILEDVEELEDEGDESIDDE